MSFRNLLTFAAAFATVSVSAPTVSADEYYPIIEEGKVWEYSGAYTKGADAGMALHSYKFDGTVTVNGKEYHGFTMFKSEYYKRTPDADQPVYEGPVERTGPTAFFREEEGKVYVLTKENCIYKSPVDAENTFDGPVTSDEYGEYLRYDFTLQDGQTLYMPYEDGISGETNFVRVVIEEPVEIEGTQRIRMSFDGVPESELPVPYQISEPFQGYVIEGIGSTEGGDLAVFSPSIPGIPNAIDGPTYESALSCVYNAAGEVIYGTPFGYTYHPIIEEGKVWEYESGYTRKINGQSESGMLNQFYKFDGSATVNGNVYRRFVCFKTEYWKRSGNDYDGNLTFTLTETDNEEGEFSYLREEGEKVYVLTSDNQIFSSYFFPDDRFDTEITSDRYGEYLRYDFSLKNGETFLLCADSYVDELYQTTVAEETPEIVGDDECRAFSLRGEGIFYDAPIVEGLGATAHGNLALFSTTFISGKPGLDSGRQGPKAKPWRGSRLVRVYAPAGNVIYGTPRETNSVESVTADRMTLMSANGIVTAVSESGSEVRMTVYGIDGTVRAEVTGTGEATVNVSALGRGIYTVRATDGDTAKVMKIRG